MDSVTASSGNSLDCSTANGVEGANGVGSE
jgi:hypothetical protein